MPVKLVLSGKVFPICLQLGLEDVALFPLRIEISGQAVPMCSDVRGASLNRVETFVSGLRWGARCIWNSYGIRVPLYRTRSDLAT